MSGDSPKPSASTLALRQARAWQLLARALAAQQLTSDAQAAVDRLDEQVKLFAAADAARRLPAVLIEAAPELFADSGCIAVHLGNNQFAYLSAQGDATGAVVDADDGGDGIQAHAHSVADRAHPSRSAPKCRDCVHHHALIGSSKPACNHPSQPVKPDDGAPWVSPLAARLEADTCQQRGLFFCGPSAVGFAPRVG